MDIHIGSWIFPLVVTVLAIGGALRIGRSDGKAYGYAAAGVGVIATLLMAAAVIISLIAWLAWSLFR